MRERRFNMIVGSPRSGKSTFCANKIIKPYKQNVIVFKQPYNINDETFRFLPEKTMNNYRQGNTKGHPIRCKFAVRPGKIYKEHLRWVMDNFRNGLLVIDDATIFERDRLTLEMNELVSMRAHVGIDIVLIYHGLTLLPIEQFIFLNNIVIFNTSEELGYKKNKIPNKEEVFKAVKLARENYRSKDKRYIPAVVNLS